MRNSIWIYPENFSRILHEEQLYTFLFARKSTVVVHRRFNNVMLYPLGFDTREWFVPEGLRKYLGLREADTGTVQEKTT
ncbi:MAG: hypothetical protein OXI02_05745 [Candidatus Dadabacteria bacterium]|nr:hypothetical protein [Candidatus Dadabacteria bacterium]MDE0477549.1 hypothetical protein [Candidatus Dadabacteria bacterium]